VFQYLLQQKKKQEEERNALRKEVVALRIMQANYEQIVKAHQNQPGQAEMRVSDETKFHLVSNSCHHFEGRCVTVLCYISCTYIVPCPHARLCPGPELQNLLLR